MLNEDSPVYRLSQTGTESLSALDLLTAVIASSNNLAAQQKAHEKARQLMALVSNDIRLISKCSKTLILEVLTESEYTKVICAIELGKRVALAPVSERKRISSSRDGYALLQCKLQDLLIEQMWCLFLNKANEVTSMVCMSKGGTAGTVVDIKVIMKKALENNASGIILAHNHPSGNLQPSQADIDITRKMKKAGDVMDIAVLDHLIISERGYYSFADEGAI